LKLIKEQNMLLSKDNVQSRNILMIWSQSGFWQELKLAWSWLKNKISVFWKMTFRSEIF